MSEQSQLGFFFEAKPILTGQEIVKTAFDELTEERRVEIMQEIGVEEIAEPPELEQPPLFEDFAPVRKEQGPEIPWTQYIRMAQLFFDQQQFEEFQARVSKLAVRYGTKNLTATVAEALRRAES